MQPTTTTTPPTSSFDKAAIDALNELIQLDYDALHAYKQAIEKIDDTIARLDLEAFQADHERHVVDLAAAVRTLGGEPECTGRDLKGFLLEGLTALRSVTGTMGALKAMRMNEKLTNRSYERALEAKLPPAARDVVLRNREDERRHLAAIEQHIERLGGEHNRPS
jgi:uncharacterized protein (TIGR02284 family)